MVLETGVQSQVKSYQRLKKWYLIPPCWTLSVIRYVSRVKWSKLGKGVAPSPTPRCSSYWKGSLRVALNYSCQVYLLLIVIITIANEIFFFYYFIWWHKRLLHHFFSYISSEFWTKSESKCNWATGVQTCLLQGWSRAL